MYSGLRPIIPVRHRSGNRGRRSARGPPGHAASPLDQRVLTAPRRGRPAPARRSGYGSAERLAGDTDGLIVVGAVDDDGVSLEVGPTRAEHGVSLPASPVHLLGEGLGTGVE